jgi:hypothetical protein
MDILLLAVEADARREGLWEKSKQELKHLEKIIGDAVPRTRCESVHSVSAKGFASSIRDSFDKAGPHVIQFAGHAVGGNFELTDGTADMIDPLYHESHCANTRLHGIVLNGCKTKEILYKNYKKKNETGLYEGTGFVVYTTESLPADAAACFSKAFYGKILLGGSLLDSFAAGISQGKLECPLCPDLYWLHIADPKLRNFVASLAQKNTPAGASFVEVNDRGRGDGACRCRFPNPSPYVPIMPYHAFLFNPHSSIHDSTPRSKPQRALLPSR